MWGTERAWKFVIVLKSPTMKYKIFKVSNWWSTKKMKQDAEVLINEKVNEGWEFLSMAFGFSHGYIPTLLIPMRR